MQRVQKVPSKHEITAPVLVPDEVDYDEHTYNEEEVYKACRNYTENCNRASIQHCIDISKDTAYFVEHYITPADMVISNPEGEDIQVKKGTWMATMKINSEPLWQEVENKSLTGFSIQALAKSVKVSKAKVAGRKASEEGIKVTKRLTDIDFSRQDHHIALVDEACNATQILVVKSKQTLDDDKNNKEDIMDKVEDQEVIEPVIEVNTEHLEELKKAKEKEATLEQELVDLRKAKAEADKIQAEYIELKKAKEESEKLEFISKAKSFKADDAEVFGVILRKCKYALEATEYVELCKQLEKLSNIEINKEKIADVGENDGRETVTKSKDELHAEKRQKYIAEGMSPADASKRARLELN